VSGLDGIRVRVELQASSPGLGGWIVAIAAEIASLLDRLATDAGSGAIDVRSLPMTTADRAQLREFLGAGEVQATIDADGPSTVRETAIPGVWWSEHRNRDGELLAELIEVCRVPEILMPAPDELAGAGRQLRERIATLTMRASVPAPAAANKL
jgi:hydrogenase-1 operon protein HyaF